MYMSAILKVPCILLHFGDFGCFVVATYVRLAQQEGARCCKLHLLPSCNVHHICVI